VFSPSERREEGIFALKTPLFWEFKGKCPLSRKFTLAIYQEKPMKNKVPEFCKRLYSHLYELRHSPLIFEGEVNA
jgi:hypothetical protein